MHPTHTTPPELVEIPGGFSTKSRGRIYRPMGNAQVILIPADDYYPNCVTADATGHVHVMIGGFAQSRQARVPQGVSLDPRTQLPARLIIAAINTATSCQETFPNAEVAWRWLLKELLPLLRKPASPSSP